MRCKSDCGSVFLRSGLACGLLVVENDVRVRDTRSPRWTRNPGAIRLPMDRGASALKCGVVGLWHSTSPNRRRPDLATASKRIFKQKRVASSFFGLASIDGWTLDRPSSTYQHLDSRGAVFIMRPSVLLVRRMGEAWRPRPVRQGRDWAKKCPTGSS